jgi:hypothetical protein
MKINHGSIAVEWNGDFHFGVDPSNAMFDITNPIAPTCAVGASFLSGKQKCHVAYVEKDGSIKNYKVFGAILHLADSTIEDLKPNDSLAICGVGANSKMVVDICRRTKARSVSVSPLNKYLAPFGFLVGTLTMMGKVKPFMTRFCKPCDKSIDAEGNEFDSTLEGDGLGKMAHLVQARTPVVNQMMTTPEMSVFYGRVLSTGGWWGEPVFLMLPRIALKYFPTEPLSARNYASTWVPVCISNTEEFAKASGFGRSKVNIFVASEITHGLGSFLRFVEMMSKDEFVVSSDPKDMPIPDRIPIFRHHCVYNINADIFREVVLES